MTLVDGTDVYWNGSQWVPGISPQFATTVTAGTPGTFDPAGSRPATTLNELQAMTCESDDALEPRRVHPGRWDELLVGRQRLAGRNLASTVGGDRRHRRGSRCLHPRSPDPPSAEHQGRTRRDPRWRGLDQPWRLRHRRRLELPLGWRSLAARCRADPGGHRCDPRQPWCVHPSAPGEPGTDGGRTADINPGAAWTTPGDYVTTSGGAELLLGRHGVAGRCRPGSRPDRRQPRTARFVHPRSPGVALPQTLCRPQRAGRTRDHDSGVDHGRRPRTTAGGRAHWDGTAWQTARVPAFQPPTAITPNPGGSATITGGRCRQPRRTQRAGRSGQPAVPLARQHLGRTPGGRHLRSLGRNLVEATTCLTAPCRSPPPLGQVRQRIRPPTWPQTPKPLPNCRRG